MHRRNAVFVHRNPRPDKQHRRADSPDQIPEQRAEKKKERISHRTARRLDAQMNSTGDNEEGTHDDHKRYVIDCGVNDARRLPDSKELIKTNSAGKRDTKFVVMTLPMVVRNQRAEGNSQQEDYERQHDEPVRTRRDETQNRNHLAIGLIATRFVNESRSYSACFENSRKR